MRKISSEKLEQELKRLEQMREYERKYEESIPLSAELTRQEGDRLQVPSSRRLPFCQRML